MSIILQVDGLLGKITGTVYGEQVISTNGKAGVIVPEGIMFVGQAAFLDVRRKLISDNKLLAVITLPHGVFKPYASVKTHALIVDKKLARISKNVLFIEINADGFSQSDTRHSVAQNDIPEASRALYEFKRSIETGCEFDSTDYECVASVVTKKKFLQSNLFT